MDAIQGMVGYDGLGRRDFEALYNCISSLKEERARRS